MYTLPPLAVHSEFTTSAIVNTGTPHTLIAAPPAGYVIRLRYAWVVIPQQEPAANIFRFFLTDDTDFPYAATTLGIPNGRDQWTFDFPGIHISSEGALVIRSYSTAVSRIFNCGAHYHVDKLTA
jgi:hypothetical protein